MATQTPKTKTIYRFPEPTFIENIIIRPNGHLILTTFRKGSVYNLDPNAVPSEPELVTELPGVTALTGIVQVEKDIYAIAGGVKAGPMKFEQGSMKVFLLDLRRAVSHTAVTKTIPVEEAPLINGMANVPENPHIVLALDSIEGQVFRIDTRSDTIDVVLKHKHLGLSTEPGKVPLGANGTKIRDGYIYFTNSAQELFCRVRIASDGATTSDVEVMTHNQDAKHNIPYDDFDFDSNGNAWVTVHSESIYRIDPQGKQTLFIGGEGSPLQEPTSLAVSKDSTKLYVACAGKMGEWCGSIVEVQLP